MTTPRLYDTMLAAVRQNLPDVRRSQQTSLAVVMTGIARAQSAHIGKIARNMPLTTRQDSKEQRVRRLTTNPLITAKSHYQPVVRRLIAGLVRQPMHVVLDRVLLHDRHNLLVAGLACKRRVIPLAWKLLPHKGASDLEAQQQVLSEALELLPQSQRITVHADSEFRSQELFTWLRERGCEVFVGVHSSLLVSTTPSEAPVALVERVKPSDGVVYFNQVYVAAAQQGPVNLYAWWSKNDRDEPILRVVQTTRAATPHSYRVGKRRMWIENTFRDWQSNGFGLDTTGLLEGERLVRLLVPVLLVYIWLMSVGRWVSQKSKRALVDGGAPHQRAGQWGLFQRGVAWFQRQLALELPPPPVRFYLAP